MRIRTVFSILMIGLACAGARAESRVLDGAEVSRNTAQKWCIAPTGPLPNWDSPADPNCEMVWRVLAEREGHVLYSARYAWPSPTHSRRPMRVLTEVLFEGAHGAPTLKRLFAVQEDEGHVVLAPLRVLSLGGMTVIESTVCMAETNECGRDLVAWDGGKVTPIKDETIVDIRRALPKDYDLRMNPSVDLAKLLGSGSAWAKRDADCCPSAAITFTLRLVDGQLRAEDLKLTPRTS
jgi:hypothetical protein